MGRLENGSWVADRDYPKTEKASEFRREATRFRHFISDEPESRFPAEAGRYHLFVSYACPWAHRTLIFRKLKGLEKIIAVSSVSPYMTENGWTFQQDFADVDTAPLAGVTYLRELYLRSDPHCSGRVTVPVLWDTKHGCIVNNESSDIIRMFNSQFDHLTGNVANFYPEHLQEKIDQMNNFIYHHINNGVYKCGLAVSQKSYEAHCRKLFKALDTLENTLEEQDCLFGMLLTEADWRLFTSLIRFDLVYATLFKCSMRRIRDYPNLAAFTRKLYEYPGIRETTKVSHIKAHYFTSFKSLNPSGIVPLGPCELFCS